MRNGKELWWHKYRRKQCRQRKKVNLEVAIRCILKRCFKEYTNNCSIVGVKQMIDPKNAFKERIAWFLLFVGTWVIFFYFSWYVWFENLSMPLMVTMESSSYPISKFDFPAVAICNVNRISKKALFEFEENTLKRKIAKDIRQTITWQFGGLLDYTYNETKMIYYIQRVAHLWDAEKVISTMKKLAPSCDEMLLTCMWSGLSVDCKKIFTVSRTFRGHCCAFNYILDSAGTPNSSITVKRQLQPGLFHGLNVLIDPLIEDYAYTTSNVPGVEILIFDATHYADPNVGRFIQWIAEPDRLMYIGLNSVKQIASRELRKYAVKTRKCIFRDEMMDTYHSMYSYSACIVHCRIKTLQALCKCTPYYLPTISNIPTCTLEQVPCLNKYKEKLLIMYPTGAVDRENLKREFSHSLHCPECFPDCEYTRHKSKAFKVNVDPDKQRLFRKFDTSINMTNKCYVSIYQSTSQGTLNRMDAVSYWYELVSDVGSVGGILLALSIFAFMEFIYFFIVKFVYEICALFLNKI